MNLKFLPLGSVCQVNDSDLKSVVIGYKIVNGETFVVCNDPNINSRFGEGLFVRYEYPLEVFMNFWRKVVYTVEK